MLLNNQFYTFSQAELKTIGGKLKEKMIEKGFSQNSLAEASGISRPTINGMINGCYAKNGTAEKVFHNPKPQTLLKLCDVLGCDMEYFTGEIEHSTHDLQFICEYTGLSEEAIEKLHFDVQHPEYWGIDAMDETGNNPLPNNGFVKYCRLPNTINKIIMHPHFIPFLLSTGRETDTDRMVIESTLREELINKPKKRYATENLDINELVNNNTGYINEVLSNWETGLNYSMSQKLLEYIEQMHLGFREEEYL